MSLLNLFHSVMSSEMVPAIARLVNTSFSQKPRIQTQSSKLLAWHTLTSVSKRTIKIKDSAVSVSLAGQVSTALSQSDLLLV